MSENVLLAELRALRLDLADLSAGVVALEQARGSESGENQITVSYSVIGPSSSVPGSPILTGGSGSAETQ